MHHYVKSVVSKIHRKKIFFSMFFSCYGLGDDMEQETIWKYSTTQHTVCTLALLPAHVHKPLLNFSGTLNLYLLFCCLPYLSFANHHGCKRPLHPIPVIYCNRPSLPLWNFSDSHCGVDGCCTLMLIAARSSCQAEREQNKFTISPSVSLMQL